MPEFLFSIYLCDQDGRIMRRFITRADSLEEARDNFDMVNAVEAAEGERLLKPGWSLNIGPVEWEHPIVEL